MKDRIDYIKNELRDEIKDNIYKLSRDEGVFSYTINKLQDVLYEKSIIYILQNRSWSFDQPTDLQYHRVIFDGTTPNIEFIDNSVKEEPTLTNKSITADRNEPTEIEQEEYWHIVHYSADNRTVLSRNFFSKEEAAEHLGIVGWKNVTIEKGEYIY